MMDRQPMVLLVEDNPDIMHINSRYLTRKGFRVSAAYSLAEAREKLTGEVEAIVLDVILPDGSGLDFIREVRRVTKAPILMLTEKRGREEIFTGLMEGADDYITKPYRLDELYARIVAALRREAMHSRGQKPDLLHKGDLSLDLTSAKAYCRGRDMLLSQKEFAILLLLMQNPEQMLDRDAIYRAVWSMEGSDDTRTVWTHISRLRRKLEGSGFEIRAYRGEGYAFGEEKPER